MGDLSSIPGLERFPREGNGNPLQHSCLENPIDRAHIIVQTPLEQEALFLLFIALSPEPKTNLACGKQSMNIH